MAAGCQPKANITTIENPMDSFSPALSDSGRGAATIQDLAAYLFLSLKGEINFEELSRFIPDSGNIAMIYQLTQTAAKDDNLKAIADTAQSMLQSDWIKTRSEASELKANWSDAVFIKLQIMDIENQKLPSKKIMLECKSGTQTLRASARCLMIGDKWFIGEDIKFGM